MQLALIGGTGDIGEAFALRFGRDTDHELWIGSRDAEKAESAAAEYEAELSDRGVDPSIRGADNETAAQQCGVVVLSVPPYHVEDTVASIEAGLDPDTTLVSPAVGMRADEDGLHYHPPSAGSVTQLVAETAPDDVPVVGAGTNLSAERLADLDESFDMDTLVVGDATDEKERIATLFEGIRGVRSLDAGPLANAAEVESLTPLLVNLARHNDGVDHAGAKFV